MYQSWSKDGFPLNLMRFHFKQPVWSSEIFNFQDELSGNGSGTVVIRSPKGISRTSAFREHISQSQVVFKLSYSDKKLIICAVNGNFNALLSSTISFCVHSMLPPIYLIHKQWLKWLWWYNHIGGSSFQILSEWVMSVIK
jgi:hypothetical protein